MEEDNDETDDASEVLRVSMPVGTARALAKRTREVMGAASDLRDLRSAD